MLTGGLLMGWAATAAGYSYDALGRIATETSNGLTHTYGYDLAGNRTRVHYGVPGGQAGRVLVSAYDALNRLATLGDGASQTSYRYDLEGHLRARTLPDGETESTSYDALGRQSASRDATGAGALLYAYDYGYDEVGSLTRMVEYKAGLPTRCVTLSYDAAERLEEEAVYRGTSVHGTPATATTYAYDEMGNRTSRQVAGAATTTYAYDAAGRLAGWSDGAGQSATYTYDGNGNRATRSGGPGGDAVYGYDVENRLVALSQGGVSYAYAYDYRTRRVSRQEGTTATAVVYSGGTSVAEYPTSDAGGATGGASVEFVRGSDWGGGVGGILYSVHAGSGGGGGGGGSTSYDHYDGRGDVTTQTSAAGVVTWQADYEAWGTRTAEFGGNPDRQRANTKEEDPTGLLNEGRRIRDLETGCFITKDPAGFVDGPNLYAYVNQNPWSKFDPQGLWLSQMLPSWAQSAFNDPLLSGLDHDIDVGIEAAKTYGLARQTGSGVVASGFLATGMGVSRMTGAMDWAEAVNGEKIVQSANGGLETQEMGADEIAFKAVTGAASMVGTGLLGAMPFAPKAVVPEGLPVPEAAPPPDNLGGKSALTTVEENQQTVSGQTSPIPESYVDQTHSVDMTAAPGAAKKCSRVPAQRPLVLEADA